MQKQSRKSDNNNRSVVIFLTVMVFSFSFLIAAGLLALIPADWKLEKGEITEFQVKGYRKATTYDGNYGKYFVAVKYRFKTENGKYIESEDWCRPKEHVVFRFRKEANSFMSGIKIGDALDIWYDPENQQNSTCNKSYSIKYKKTAIFLFSIFLLINILNVVLWGKYSRKH